MFRMMLTLILKFHGIFFFLFWRYGINRLSIGYRNSSVIQIWYARNNDKESDGAESHTTSTKRARCYSMFSIVYVPDVPHTSIKKDLCHVHHGLVFVQVSIVVQWTKMTKQKLIVYLHSLRIGLIDKHGIRNRKHTPQRTICMSQISRIYYYQFTCTGLRCEIYTDRLIVHTFWLRQLFSW